MKSVTAQISSLTILSGVVAFISYLLVAMSVNYNFEVFNDPTLLLTLPEVNVSMLRWSMITDVLGYYLLLVPALFFLQDWMQAKTAWSKPLTFCGIAYVLIGSMGASVLTVVWPLLIAQYPTASLPQQATITLLFDTTSELVYGGLWNLLAMLVGGIWWTGVGLQLWHIHKALAITTLVVGGCALADTLGGMLQLAVLAEVGLNIYLVLAPLWAIWLGLALRKI